VTFLFDPRRKGVLRNEDSTHFWVFDDFSSQSGFYSEHKSNTDYYNTGGDEHANDTEWFDQLGGPEQPVLSFQWIVFEDYVHRCNGVVLTNQWLHGDKTVPDFSEMNTEEAKLSL